MKINKATKSGYVAIVGRPNVGKSTLLNRLVGEKLGIVTSKPQTTRNVILGIATDDESQMVLLDTPGLLKPRYELQEAMAASIKRSLKDADVVLLLLDATLGDQALSPEERKRLGASPIPTVLAINKVDIAGQQQIDQARRAAGEYVSPERLALVSALTGERVDELRGLLRSLLPAGPFLYPPDQIAEQPERFFAAEIIREKIFSTFRQEVPYSAAVMVDEFREREPKTYIRATIYVEKPSQKAILVGTHGEMLKQVGRAARADIERFIDHPAYLELWVKVREKWRKKQRDLREFGYLK